MMQKNVRLFYLIIFALVADCSIRVYQFQLMVINFTTLNKEDVMVKFIYITYIMLSSAKLVSVTCPVAIDIPTR